MDTHKITAQVELLQSYIPQHAAKASNISQQGVGWHIAHCLKVIDSVLQATITSQPEEYSPKFSLPKLIVMTTGYIPRGKAKSPKVVTPESSDIAPKQLEELISSISTNLTDIQSKTQANSHFPHPIFGHLKRSEVPRFLEVHTKHHVKIIDDIIK